MNKSQRHLLIVGCLFLAMLCHFSICQWTFEPSSGTQLFLFIHAVRGDSFATSFVLGIVFPLIFIIAAGFFYFGKPRFSSPPLEDYLDQMKNDDKNVRAASIQALTDIEASASTTVPALIKSLKDSDEEVRVQAARALANFGPKAKPAVEALIEALEDKAGAVRGRSARALGKIGWDASRAVDSLTRALKDEDELVRLYALEALTRIKGQPPEG